MNNQIGDYNPFQPYPDYYQPYQAPFTSGFISVVSTPTECSGDVHVFPCKKCGECRCGKARIAGVAK